MAKAKKADAEVSLISENPEVQKPRKWLILLGETIQIS
jgi:hypothetical protein